MQSPTSSLVELLNLPDLLDRVDNDLEFLRELIELFRMEFPRLQIELQQAVLEKNMPLAASTAHTLKGMLANLSMEPGAVAAETVEHMGNAEDLQGAQSALVIFNNNVAGLLPGLDEYLAASRV